MDLPQVEAPGSEPQSTPHPVGGLRLDASTAVVLEAVSQPGLWLGIDPQVLHRCKGSGQESGERQGGHFFGRFLNGVPCTHAG